MRHLLLTILAIIGLVPTLIAQGTSPIHGIKDNSTAIHAFEHATIQLKPGWKISDATLVIQDSRILDVGRNVNIPNGAVIHDLKGAWIYAGFIDPYSNFGQEVVPKTKRGRSPEYTRKEQGTMAWNAAVHPEYQVVEHLKMKNENAKNLRKLGFILVNSVPTDGIFSGTSCLISLNDKKLAEAVRNHRLTACMSFQKGSSIQSYPSSLMGSIALIRQTFLDAQWYEGISAARTESINEEDEVNSSLEQILAQRKMKLPILFESKAYLNTLQAAAIAKEFDLNFIYKTEGDEYLRLNEIEKLNAQFILPLTFPEAYKFELLEDERNVSLSELRKWEQSTGNAARLAEKKIPFSFTLAGLKKKNTFKTAVIKTIDNGLEESNALTALTTAPAEMLGIQKDFGTLEKGKIASFFICSGNYFEEKSKLQECWVEGKAFIIEKVNENELEGKWKLESELLNLTLKFNAKSNPPTLNVQQSGDTNWTKASLKLEDSQIHFQIKLGKDKTGYRFAGFMDGQNMNGNFSSGEIKRNPWKASFDSALNEDEKNKKDEKKGPKKKVGKLTYPNMAYGWETEPKVENILINNVTLWTNTEQGKIEGGSIWIRNGKIEAIGKTLNASGGAKIIDGTGMHVTPGIIDEHSHIAIFRGVNEGSHAITSEVRIRDVINPDDINIYRQLGGGVTTSHLLHGSANPIGGQTALIKMRWGRSPEEMKFEGADLFIKFALGENVKQSNWGDQFKIRYPQTRLGVDQIMRDGFQRALDYKKKRGDSKNGPDIRRDIQLDALLDIMESRMFITCHSYVQSELNMLMKLAEDHDFRVNTFTHVLEGYKVASQLKAHGAYASTFSDWWAYKYEVIDAIPYNAALMADQGITVCINSDDAEMGRRLNQEAAKAIKYGGLSEEEALKLVTLNPAKALHIDDRVGALKTGMDGDIVLWSDNPLSVYAKVVKTFIDGRIYFDQETDLKVRKEIAIERAALIKKMQAEKGAKAKVPGKKEEKLYHCDTLESAYNHE